MHPTIEDIMKKAVFLQAAAIQWDDLFQQEQVGFGTTQDERKKTVDALKDIAASINVAVKALQ